MANVRFYKLNVLPTFEVKHQGIFVHVTGIMDKNGGNPKNPATLWMTLGKDGGSVGRINLEQWLTERYIETIESGLWFGGENGWELLSNETNSAAIDAAIVAKIATLHVDGYAQATITPDTPAEGEPNSTSSTLTIKGIQEVDGKIGIPADSENLDLDIAIDGVYNEINNKIATQDTVTNAINNLDANTVQAVTFNTPVNGGNTTLTFNGIKEENGVIAQGASEGAGTFIVGDAKLKIQIGSAAAYDVFSANAQADSTIQLDGNVFTKNGDVISVITPTAVSSDNRLVTEQDIASLGGAMHYKGALTGAQSGVGSWPSTVAAGDVYIVTTSFTHSDESNPFEVGDMIVFNSTSASDYTVVQSNITLGIQSGQIAKNDGNLTSGNIVVATGNGIKTIGISETNLTDINDNHRHLSIGPNGPADGDFHHDVTITDALKVIGKDFSNSINISSPNRSINIINKNVDTGIGVMVDLVWNTRLN